MPIQAQIPAMSSLPSDSRNKGLEIGPANRSAVYQFRIERCKAFNGTQAGERSKPT